MITHDCEAGRRNDDILIRAPERVVAGNAVKNERVALGDAGFPRQADLFDRIADRTGIAPPVIEAEAARPAWERLLPCAL